VNSGYQEKRADWQFQERWAELGHRSPTPGDNTQLIREVFFFFYEPIDYTPPSDTVRAGRVRVYRRNLTAGQTLQVTLETLSGDADLYVWRPDGNQSWLNNNSGAANDNVSLTAPQTGVYQIEVYGYQESQCRLTIVGGTAGMPVRTVQHINTDKSPCSQPVIAPINEPAGDTAVSPSPIGPSQRKLYLPVILR
jgi:hypothetical protein